jgi:hypothetical protein
VGRPSTRRRSASPGLGCPAPYRCRCQGSVAPGHQRRRLGFSCSGDAAPDDAGAIHHRGATYLGRTQESPGGCRGLTSRKLCLPKARVPLGASRNVLPTHVGGLGPHRAHAGRDACRPGPPWRRATPLRPSSPPRGKGAPRLPPQAQRTLRQRRGSEPLARTTRSVSLQPSHTTGAIPGPVPSPDYHRQVLRGDKARVVVCGLPAGMLVGRGGRRQPHHPQPPPVPLRRYPGLAGASASCADLRLGRPGQGVRWKLPRHVRAPWELMGSLKLPPVARGIPARVHPEVFEAAHRVAQHHRLGRHRGVPCRHHLPRPGEQTRA